MKYLSTINLWDNSTQQAVARGQIKLQRGQWVKCGDGKLSRFVGIRNGCLWVAHWQGTAKATAHRFNQLTKAIG